MNKLKSVDDYLASVKAWRDELTMLRDLLRESGLEETIKWGAPCYVYNGQNVVGLSGFKSYFGLWFHQGALLADKDKVLINAQEGKTKGMRQWRMGSKSEIKPAQIKRYVKEAMALAKSDIKIAPARGKPVVVPAALEKALAANKKAAAAFADLTPGRKREYTDYVDEAMLEETKLRRIEKILPMIAAGKGLNDKYR